MPCRVLHPRPHPHPHPPPAPHLRRINEAACLHGAGRVLLLEPKDALLLAYLALVRPTPRSLFAVLLWPDVDEACARAKLRQRLFQLRKAPGFELLQGTEVASLAAQVQVDLAHADTDAGSGQFLTGVAEAEAGALAAGLDSALRLHCLRGDRASALAAFDRCCDVLARVLGVAPEVETEALRGHIEAMRQPASPAGRSRFR